MWECANGAKYLTLRGYMAIDYFSATSLPSVAKKIRLNPFYLKLIIGLFSVSSEVSEAKKSV